MINSTALEETFWLPELYLITKLISKYIILLEMNIIIIFVTIQFQVCREIKLEKSNPQSCIWTFIATKRNWGNLPYSSLV